MLLPFGPFAREFDLKTQNILPNRPYKPPRQEMFDKKGGFIRRALLKTTPSLRLEG